MKANQGLSAVEVSIVLAILLLVAAIAAPALFQNRQKQQAARCAMNLDAIAAACKKHAAERGGFPAALADLAPDYLETVPVCPAGGTYTLGTPEGDPPTCSVPGHHF